MAFSVPLPLYPCESRSTARGCLRSRPCRGSDPPFHRSCGRSARAFCGEQEQMTTPVRPYSWILSWIILLAGLGTHVLIIGGKHNARLFCKRLRDLLHVDGRGNIAAAPAYEDADSLHCLSSLTSYISGTPLAMACCGSSLSRISGMRSGFRRSMPCWRIDRAADSLNKLCRLHISRDSAPRTRSSSGRYRCPSSSKAPRSAHSRPWRRTDADGSPFRHRPDSLPSICRSACTFWGSRRMMRVTVSIRSSDCVMRPPPRHAKRLRQKLGKIDDRHASFPCSASDYTCTEDMP